MIRRWTGVSNQNRERYSRNSLILYDEIPTILDYIHLQLRMLQSEMNVEDIIKERTFKTFNERCRLFFSNQPM